MEIISFYYLNILVGALLAVVLGLFGSHVVARNKTIEIVLLGQAIQVGILFGFIVTASAFEIHDEHGLHLEIIVSIIFTVLLYALYSWLTRGRATIKTPLLILAYTLLLALSYLVVAVSPLVESHMVKAFLGDIVTASTFELGVVLLVSLAGLIYFLRFRHFIKIQSFELSLFDHLQSSTNKTIYFFFNIFVLGLMIYSIHVLGIVFTLCMMILPVTLVQFSTMTLSQLYRFVFILAPLSVFAGFLLNIKFEQFPTSSLISLSYLALGCLFLVIKRVRN